MSTPNGWKPFRPATHPEDDATANARKKATSSVEDELAAWWKEDAASYNELGRIMQENGHTVKVDAGDPPLLNDDGSLAEEEV
jgi:hypothetical protein